MPTGLIITGLSHIYFMGIAIKNSMIAEIPSSVAMSLKRRIIYLIKIFVKVSLYPGL